MWVSSVYLLPASRGLIPAAQLPSCGDDVTHGAKALGCSCARPGRQPETLRGPHGLSPETTRGYSCLLGAFSFGCFFPPSFLTFTYESIFYLL